MEEKTFAQQVQRIIITNQIESPTQLTLKEYWEKFESVSDEAFIKMVDHILETSEYRRFPILADFVSARRAVLPAPSTFVLDMSNDDPESKAATRSWAREMAKKFPKPQKKGAVPTRAEKIQSLKDHIKNGEVFCRKRHEWIKESDMEGDNVIWPKDLLDEILGDTAGLKAGEDYL